MPADNKKMSFEEFVTNLSQQRRQPVRTLRDEIRERNKRQWELDRLRQRFSRGILSRESAVAGQRDARIASFAPQAQAALQTPRLPEEEEEAQFNQQLLTFLKNGGK